MNLNLFRNQSCYPILLDRYSEGNEMCNFRLYVDFLPMLFNMHHPLFIYFLKFFRVTNQSIFLLHPINQLLVFPFRIICFSAIVLKMHACVCAYNWYGGHALISNDLAVRFIFLFLNIYTLCKLKSGKKKQVVSVLQNGINWFF